MKPHGFKSFMKGSAVAAFLAVAAPAEAPAQSFDMMSPNSIMNPVHPMNPITDPFNVWRTHDAPAHKTPQQQPAAPKSAPAPDSAATDHKKEQQNNAGIPLLIGLGAAFGFAGAMILAGSDKPKPPAPLQRSPRRHIGPSSFY